METGMALPRGRWTGRETRIGLGVAVLVTFLGACLIVGPASAAAKKHGSKKLSLSFKSKSQSDQGLLSVGKVDVVVRSPRKRKLVLAVRGFGGGPALTDPLRVKAKTGKKGFSLPLSAA